MTRLAKALWISFMLAVASPDDSRAATCQELYLDWFDGLLEGDVFPRPSPGFAPAGDGTIRFLDWNIILHEAMNLSAPEDDCDFMVADCAPAGTRGDGVIDIADVLQTFRTSLGLEHAILGPPNGPGP